MGERIYVFRGEMWLREEKLFKNKIPTLPREIVPHSDPLEIVPPGGKSEGGAISRTAKRGDNFSYCRGVAVLV